MKKLTRIISIATSIILLTLSLPTYVNAETTSHRSVQPPVDFRTEINMSHEFYLEEVEERLTRLATQDRYFPAEKYWNHQGLESLNWENANHQVINYDWTQVTGSPCQYSDGDRCHNVNDAYRSCSSCNYYWDGNSHERSDGFARMICELVFASGSHVDESDWSDGSVSSLCIGDYVRDTVSKHSFVVYRIENGQVTAYECDYGSDEDHNKNCLITNNRTISLDTLQWMANSGRLVIRHCNRNLNIHSPEKYWELNAANTSETLSYDDVSERIEIIKTHYFIPGVGMCWNHVGDDSAGSYNSTENHSFTTTVTTCSSAGFTHAETIYNVDSCGSYDNWFHGACQCEGFARLITCGIFGTDYHTGAGQSEWVDSTLDNICIGDYVWDYGLGHAFVITGVEGNNITYIQCNIPGGSCLITEDTKTFDYFRDRSLQIKHCIRNQSSQQSSSSTDTSNSGTGTDNGNNNTSGANEANSSTGNSSNSGSSDNHEPTAEERGYIPSMFTVGDSVLDHYDLKMESQGVLYREVVKNFMPNGFTEAQSVNILNQGVTDRCLKDGTMYFKIPQQFRKAGRCFAIFAVDKNGIPYLFMDKDSDADTITIDVKFEGYAFSIIYTDDPMLYYSTPALPFVYIPSA